MAKATKAAADAQKPTNGMLTSVADLASVGGFCAPKPKRVEVQFKIGKIDYTASVFIRQLSIAEQERMFSRLTGSAGQPVSRSASLISTLVGFGEEGLEEITPDQANALNPALGNALLEKIREVNGQVEKN